jgi:hypothetical protein
VVSGAGNARVAGRTPIISFPMKQFATADPPEIDKNCAIPAF